jgi:hypothetical protein
MAAPSNAFLNIEPSLFSELRAEFRAGAPAACNLAQPLVKKYKDHLIKVNRGTRWRADGTIRPWLMTTPPTTRARAR